MSDINLDFFLIAIRMVANWNSFGSKLKIIIILEERVDILYGTVPTISGNAFW